MVGVEGALVTVIITVSGRHEASYPPERCTVHLTVQVDGPVAADVSSTMGAQTADLTRRITDLGVTEWFVDQIHRSRHRPYSESGTQLPYVHTASTEVRATFSDFDLVGPFVDGIVDLDAVTVGRFEWTLTDESRRAHLAHVRDRAVTDAVDKATAYAMSLSLSGVRPVALADPGLMDAPPGSPRAMAAMAKGADSIAVRPEDITIDADVHVRFEAS